MFLLRRACRAPIPLSRCLSTANSSPLALARSRNAPVDIHPEVEEALATNKPVVALETALVSHGVPYPTNLELGLELENLVRSTGCVPATIGFIGGRVKIGLEKHEVERLAEKTFKPSKISRRDVAAAIAMKADGGTTCSTTLIFAALAGIKVFATGGLGGVHRGAESTMDISADLHELTRCPVGLVSGGVKSILDIGKTLEYLETLGVPVLTYGESKEFPAFFSRHSGFEVPWNVPDPSIAAAVLHAQWQLGMNNGALIAVPVPEEHAADGATIQKIIDQAVAESEANGVSRRGKEATPWLLDRINTLSQGKSLKSNIALLKNTAIVGGQIAVQYHKLADERCSSAEAAAKTLQPRNQPQRNSAIVHKKKDASLPPAEIMIVGCAALDITAQARTDTNPALAVHSTAPGSISLSLGGVSRNVAEACHRVMTAQSSPLSTLLVAPIGDDPFGRLLIEETEKFGMRTDGLITSDKHTAVCNMVLDSHGSLVGGVADMDITESFSGDTVIAQIKKHRPSIVALDGNLSEDAIKQIVHHCADHNIKIFFEPTSVIKSTNILPAVSAAMGRVGLDQAPVDFFSPNLLELSQVYQVARTDPHDIMSHQCWWTAIDSLSLGSAFRMDLEQLAKNKVSDEEQSKGSLSFLVDQGSAQMAVNLLPLFQHLVIKCGERGVLVAMRISAQDAANSNWSKERSNPRKRYIVARGKTNEIVVLQHFPPLPVVEKVVNVTGAGDSFGGALLACLAKNPKAFQDVATLERTISAAQMAAILSLQSHFAVSPLLSRPATI
ncbi:indigoidine synthase A-like protein [Crucibulum laeve]|uniref:Indigoidine synthase A-like protein n=1 Tax=Crucibulum laeve TaxID=68775 RepID=A0A5C3M929_9AGAR|nr:indigoidine synthase A-like protein [Crucibulum laeve]